MINCYSNCLLASSRRHFSVPPKVANRYEATTDAQSTSTHFYSFVLSLFPIMSFLERRNKDVRRRRRLLTQPQPSGHSDTCRPQDSRYARRLPRVSPSNLLSVFTCQPPPHTHTHIHRIFCPPPLPTNFQYPPRNERHVEAATE